ncbi:MAG: CHAT domain-containing protein [bacterium]|nr:CHAT domain-containing protein [bacterium]
MKRWKQLRCLPLVLAALAGAGSASATPPGWGDPAFADTAEALAELYLARGEFRAAEALLEHALAIREAFSGPQHPETAATLHQLGTLCREAGWTGSAETYLLRAADVRRRVLGKDHLELASTLQELGLLYATLRLNQEELSVLSQALEIYQQAYGAELHLRPDGLDAAVAMLIRRQQLTEAESLLLDALERETAERGEDHRRVADLHERLGNVYNQLQREDSARRHFEKALEIREKLLGSHHHGLWGLLENLASFHLSAARLAEVEPYYRRLLAITERFYEPGSIHQVLAETLIANYHIQRGRLEASAGHYQKALDSLEPIDGRHRMVAHRIRINLAITHWFSGRFDEAERLLLRVSEDPAMAGTTERSRSTLILAVLFQMRGRYGEAESLLLEVKAILERDGATSSLPYAQYLVTLGDLYLETARFQQAEESSRRALAVARAGLSPGNPALRGYLEGRANVLAEIGRSVEAETLYAELEALEQALDPDYPRIAGYYFDRASRYQRQGRFEEAEAVYQQVIRKLEGSEWGTPLYADTLHQLGLLDARLDRLSKAEQKLRKALATRHKTLGPRHPDVALVSDHLAALLARQGRHAEAHELTVAAVAVQAASREQVFSLLGESQKLALVRTQEAAIHRLVSQAAQHLATEPSTVTETLDAWLGWKSAVLEAHGRHLDALAEAENPEIRQAWTTFQEVRREIAGVWLVAHGALANQELENRLAVLRQRQETLEAELSRLSREFALDRRSAQADSKRIAGALPPAAAYLDFARIAEHDFLTGERHDPRYVLFVLTAGDNPSVKLIDLGAATAVDRAVEEYLARIREQAPAGTLQELARSLYDLLLAPAAAALADRSDLRISPDGTLHLLPFEALRTPDGEVLIESLRVSYLASGRDLLRRDPPADRSGVAVVMADPDYDLGGAERRQRIADLGMEAGALRGGVSRDLRGMHFQRLPGAREEGTAVGRILRRELNMEVASYTGDRALEEVLLAVRSPRVLHLATHGFFLRDAADARDAGGERGAADLFFPPRSSPADAESPLLRSGIALAGANTAIAEGRHEGLVSAAKVIGLDVRGADLVVLSACDTARGDIRNGEGVFGLQRAFMYAGARTLVMTRWQVDDDTAKEVMTEFYRLWSTGLTKAEALRQAKRKLRAEHPHPYHWAAPFLVGDPR